MRLRNTNAKKSSDHDDNSDSDGDGDTWQPSAEGFVKYLVDSKLVFATVERIVDESSDVSCKLLLLVNESSFRN